MVYTIKDKDSGQSSHSIYRSHLQSLWRKCQSHDRQWDRVQERTLQGSLREVRHRIFHPFNTIQTTKQWEDRGISQIPKGMHRQTHKPWIKVG